MTETAKGSIQHHRRLRIALGSLISKLTIESKTAIKMQQNYNQFVIVDATIAGYFVCIMQELERESNSCNTPLGPRPVFVYGSHGWLCGTVSPDHSHKYAIEKIRGLCSI